MRISSITTAFVAMTFFATAPTSNAGPPLGLGSTGFILAALSRAARNPDLDARNRLVRLYPLHWATIQDQADVIEILIDSGIDVDVRDAHGRTPLMTAAEFGNLSAMKALLALGANVEARDREKGDSALHYCGRHGHADACQLLLDRGMSVDIRSVKTGRTALHYAAAFGQARTIDFLISAGADPNAIDRDGVSPIFYASRRLQRAAVKRLERYGARIGGLDEAVNANDVARIVTLLASGGDRELRRPGNDSLNLAVAKGFVGVTRILIDHGANIGARAADTGATPLQVAAMTGGREMIDFLISRGAALETRDKLGRTPLLIAVSFGNLDATRELLAQGANIKATDDIYQLSPLHFATLGGFAEIIELLVSAGSEVNVTNPITGQTPLHLAAKKDNAKAAVALLKNGADMTIRDRDGLTPKKLFHRGERVSYLLRESGRR